MKAKGNTKISSEVKYSEFVALQELVNALAKEIEIMRKQARDSNILIPKG